ncbi:MAG: hypothetical protein ACE5DX_04535 [Candidatus Dojkabacteria bacterium]
MKLFIAYTALLLAVVISSVGSLNILLKSDLLVSPQLKAIAAVSGIRRHPDSQATGVPVQADTQIAEVTAQKDNFQVVLGQVDTSFDYEQMEDFEFVYGKGEQTQVDADMIYNNSFSELPLIEEDYYYRKYENAAAGVAGINKTPIMRPGDSIGVIADRFINIKTYNGYVQPPGYYFASGVCWTSSTLGFMMDNANWHFKKRFGVNLFVFGSRDRAPHPDSYETYHGHGDTIMQITEGNPLQDFRFTINPRLKTMPEVANIKIKVMMLATDEHETASHGQSIGAYIISNKKF